MRGDRRKIYRTSIGPDPVWARHAACWSRRAALFAGVLSLPWTLQTAQAQTQPDRLACEAAIAAQQGGSGLPPGLLHAIALVESGRWDALAQRAAPWPWAFNISGASHLAESRAEAASRVRKALVRGQRSIDVGCMQINLQHHPGAFATLEEAFDPERNVAYAIRFLNQLRARHGDWPAAIARYHSGTAQRGVDYLLRVQLALGTPGPTPLAAAAEARRDRVAVLISPMALTVQVIRPSVAPQTGAR